MAQLIKKIRTEYGDLQIDYTSLANLPQPDATLSQTGAFADAKMTGDRIKDIAEKIDSFISGEDAAQTINVHNLKTDSLSLDGKPVDIYELTMGSVATGKVLSTIGDINLAHSHSVTVNDDGTITLGEVSSEGGNFKMPEFDEVLPIAKGGTEATTPIGARENMLMVVSNSEPSSPVAGTLWFDIS